MTIKEIEDIFTTKIPLEGLEVDSGIYVFHTENNMSIGISYECIEGELVYIFNIFIDGEYINIDGNYKSIYDAVEIVTNEWNDLIES